MLSSKWFFNFATAWISSVRSSWYPPSLVILYLGIIIILACICMVGVRKSNDNGGSWLSPSNMSILGTELSASALAPVSWWLSYLSGLDSLSFLIGSSQFQWAQNSYWAPVIPSSQFIILSLLLFPISLLTGHNPNVTEDRLLSLIPLPLPPGCWGYRHAPPRPVYGQISASHLLTKHFTKWTPALAPPSFRLCLE